MNKRLLGVETILVLGLSLGKSAVYSVLAIIERLTRSTPLGAQTSSLNNSVTPDRGWLDFCYQLVGNLFPFFVVALCFYLVSRIAPPTGSARQTLGLSANHFGRDIAVGFGIAAAIGIPGLAFYLFAKHIGINTTVAAGNLTQTWWAIPMYVLAAFMNGALEEVVMIGYLFTRWRQIGFKPGSIIAVSAVIRGCYHLYQGFGGAIGNLVMGLAFGYFYNKTHRLWPLIIAHTLLDIVSFVGYALLNGRLSWL